MTKHKLYTVDADTLGEFEGQVPRIGESLIIEKSLLQAKVTRVVWHIVERGESWAEVHVTDSE
jgi:hypothetical protein